MLHGEWIEGQLWCETETEKEYVFLCMLILHPVLAASLMCKTCPCTSVKFAPKPKEMNVLLPVLNVDQGFP